MKRFSDYIKEQLYNNLCDEYGYIDEGGGIYDGQLELAEYITNLLYDNSDKKKIIVYGKDLTDIQNIFFNELIIDITHNNKILHSSCDPITNIYSDNDSDEYEKYNYDKDNDKLITVKISIICNISNNHDIWKAIRGRFSHELNHMYTYWDMIRDDFMNDTLFDKKKDKFIDTYHNALHEFNDKCYSRMAEIIGDMGKFFIMKYPNVLLTYEQKKKIYISYMLLYSLTRFERNAFLSEICSYLINNAKKMSSPNNIINELKKCHQYNLYINETPQVLDDIKNDWIDSDKQFLIDAYEYVYGRKKTINKILKLLNFKLIKTIEKLNDNITYLSKKYHNQYIEESKSKFKTVYPIIINGSFYTMPDDDINWF